MRLMKALLVLVVLGSGFVLPAVASVPKVVFTEEFGWAT